MSASNDDHGGDDDDHGGGDDDNENDREEKEDGTGVDINWIDRDNISSLQKWNSLKLYHKRRSVRDKNDKK